MGETAASAQITLGHGMRYMGGAVLCALLNNIVLIVGDAAGLPDLAGVVLAWLGGGTLAYLWHHRISFGTPPSIAAWLRLLAGSALAIPLAWLTIMAFHQWLAWPMWLAAPAATIVMFAYNYANARLAILRRPKPQGA